MNVRIVALAFSLAAFVHAALAADTGQLPCSTTAECNQQAAKIGATIEAPNATDKATSKRDQAEDSFYWIGKINRASAVTERLYAISGQ